MLQFLNYFKLCVIIILKMLSINLVPASLISMHRSTPELITHTSLRLAIVRLVSLEVSPHIILAAERLLLMLLFANKLRTYQRFCIN